MVRRFRSGLLAAVMALWLSAPQAAPEPIPAGPAATSGAASTRAAITPEMVRKIAGPRKPDNGNLEIQPGLPRAKCLKDSKPDKPDNPKKRLRKGKC